VFASLGAATAMAVSLGPASKAQAQVSARCAGLFYEITMAGISSFQFANSKTMMLRIGCGLIPVVPVNPLGSGGLAAVVAATGFAGTQNLNNSLGSNVRSRFFGGDQFAESGQAFQLASAYRASGLGQRADARSKVALTPEGRMRWSVWFKGTGTWLNDGTAGASYDGTLYSLTGGIDYFITDNILVGALVGYEDFKLNTTFNNGAFDGKGFSVGPYVGIRFLRHFLFNAVLPGSTATCAAPARRPRRRAVSIRPAG